MLKSYMCHLQGMTQDELIQHKEDPNELGGIFIVNGNEKLIRLFITPKRNHPFAQCRNTFLKRGPLYTNMAVSIRCLKPDQSAFSNFLHYLKHSGMQFRFNYMRIEYTLPVALLLKALTNASDLDIFKQTNNQQILRDIHQYNASTQQDYLALLGQRFSSILGLIGDATASGHYLLCHMILPHATDYQQKYDLLIFMINQLMDLANGRIQADDMDATSTHEVLLPGHLYNAIIKEHLHPVSYTHLTLPTTPYV